MSAAWHVLSVMVSIVVLAVLLPLMALGMLVLKVDAWRRRRKAERRRARRGGYVRGAP